MKYPIIRTGGLAALLLVWSVGFPKADAASTHHAHEMGQDVFSLLEGSWVGTGVLLGRPATFQMRWSTVLDNRFVRLDFENGFAAEGGGDSPPRLLEATAFYPTDGSREGWWFDSRGKRLSLTVRAHPSILDVLWEEPTERGRTVYTVGSGQVAVVDSVWTGGEYREFARATYRRLPAPGEE